MRRAGHFGVQPRNLVHVPLLGNDECLACKSNGGVVQGARVRLLELVVSMPEAQLLDP